MTTNIPFQKERPIFRKVANISELVNMTEQELEIYNISLDSYRTNLSVMKNERKEGMEEGLKKGLQQGREEGLQQGREEGLQQGRVEMAKSMKNDGMSTEIIIRYTGLTKEQIENL